MALRFQSGNFYDKLKGEIWWSNLMDDKDIYVEVRKDGTLDVYYDGGGLLSGVKQLGKAFTGKTHQKYLLPEISSTSPWSSVRPGAGSVNLLSLGDCSDLARIKRNIHLLAGSEKRVQAVIRTGDPYVIDSELAISESPIRFDLVRLDTVNKELVLIELKLMGDNRLAVHDAEILNAENPVTQDEAEFTAENKAKTKENIVKQLKKYRDFIKTENKAILDYYRQVLAVKGKLGLLSKKLASDQEALDLDGYQVLGKPLLVVGSCSKEFIKTSAPIINKAIKDVAAGALYFGTYSKKANWSDRRTMGHNYWWS